MKALNSIDKIFTAIGMICLFAIMVILAIDGLGRQLFNSPIRGAYLLIEKYLMVAMIFPLIGYTWAQKHHIGVNYFYDKMPIAVKNIAYLITMLLGLGIFGLIGYTGYEMTFEAFTANQMTSGLTRWPLWVSYIWMPIGSVLFCVRLITEFIICINLIGKGGLNRILISDGASSRESAD